MHSLKHAWLIAQKDMRLFSRDRISLFFNLLFPFLFVAIFGSILSGYTGEDDRMSLHVVTQEDSDDLSYLIVEAMETDDVDDLDAGEPVIIMDESYEDSRQAVADGSYGGFLAFPDGFTEGISRGYGAELEVVSDADATYDRAALESMGEAIAYQIGLQQVVRTAITSLTMETWLDPSADSSHIQQELPLLLSMQSGVPMRSSLVEYEVEQVGKVEAEEPTDYVIPGYLVMFVFMAAANSAELIVRERQNHTLERLLAASVRRQAILAGMFGGIAAKGLLQITVFWTVGLLLFDMKLGHAPAAVILLSLIMVLMSSAFALMLATLARTQRAAGSAATVVSLVLAPLGGCWWPLFITPHWMQFIAKVTPHGWATTAFNKLILFGASFGDVVPDMLVVLGFGVAFAIVALLRFRTSAV